MCRFVVHASSSATGGRAEKATAPVDESAQSPLPPKAPDGTAVGTPRRMSTASPPSARYCPSVPTLTRTKKGCFIFPSSQRSHSRTGSRRNRTASRPPNLPSASARTASRAAVSPIGSAGGAPGSTYTDAATTRPPAVPCGHVRSPTGSGKAARSRAPPGTVAGVIHTQLFGGPVPVGRSERNATNLPHGDHAGVLALVHP
mmetsp:Transcript_31104/g.61597  ORF Transcript_31104/g.61597 Transcript_31104/m.61597 type:complete len:201 (+) Transcript_31104:1536-2138(+)